MAEFDFRRYLNFNEDNSLILEHILALDTHVETLIKFLLKNSFLVGAQTELGHGIHFSWARLFSRLK